MKFLTNSENAYGTALKLPQNSILNDKSMFSSVNLSFNAVKMRHCVVF